MSREVVIVEGLRTPYAKAGTLLKDVPAQELARIVITELLARTGLEASELDHVIFGNIAQPPDAVNLARVAALLAGVPQRVPGVTVNRLCGSGLQSIVDAWYRISSGNADAIIAGGVESMSNIPFLYSRESQEIFTEVFTARDLRKRLAAASRFRPKHFKPEIGLQQGLTDAVCGLNMGETAEVLAKEHHISREEQDEFALRSHRRVTLARAKLAEEIVPVPVPPKYADMAIADNGVRENQTMEALAKLRPYFDPKFGTVTAGNSSQITDGGAATLVMSAQAAAAHGYRPLGRVRGFAFVGVEPERMGLGPAAATPLALKRARVAWQDIGLVELNEAFAAQCLAVARVFPSREWHERYGTGGPIGEIDWEKTNVNGGAIALGHPVGSSANRLVTTLLKEMHRRDVQFGLATMCIGGGQGGAVVVEAT
ncbi:MAG TPA: thiolase family protein [Thermoanaerobaculia bacterium]|jgi:acetyl-CoA acetyltransferase family protein|nr:thiolase family protein [Thermoanaerobaculia bacterium]HEV8610381.1 thiolase family protein [Thermoanaerobaculia bacterium]